MSNFHWKDLTVYTGTQGPCSLFKKFFYHLEQKIIQSKGCWFLPKKIWSNHWKIFLSKRTWKVIFLGIRIFWQTFFEKFLFNFFFWISCPARIFLEKINHKKLDSKKLSKACPRRDRERQAEEFLILFIETYSHQIFPKEFLFSKF